MSRPHCDIAEITKGLTPEQRHAICGVSSGGLFNPAARGALVLPLKADRGVLNRSIIDLGLAKYSSFGVALTPKGKNVRDRLLQEASQ